MPRKQKRINPHANPANKPALLKRHNTRTDAREPWWVRCSRVDPEALRAELSVEFVRLRVKPGLTHDERKALKAQIAELQRPKERRARREEHQYEREAL